jgi:hypothetical protein
MKESVRRKIANEIADLVNQAIALEEGKPLVRQLAKNTRPILLPYTKTLTAIGNANRFIQKGVRIWESIQTTNETTVRGVWVAEMEKASEYLAAARSSIELYMNQQLVKIHPVLRRKHEQLNPLHPTYNPVIGGHSSSLKHLRGSAVDHWLVCSLDALLVGHEKVKARRRGAICEILKLSGEDGWLESRVKTILDRENKLGKAASKP